MAKVTYPAVAHGIEGWDGELESWRVILQTGPLPIFEASSGLFANLPTASSNDRSIAFFNESTNSVGWMMAYSDGAAWKKVPRQAAAQVDSVAATVGALVTDFNGLLAKLRASGVLA
jgi:hypothetical protein